ncbi:TAXI family TRAP transporter solute-binding subunit [candidate division KSB1 bacterium]
MILSKSMRNIIIAVMIIGITLVFCVIILWNLPGEHQREEVRIATATTGGTYLILGQELAQILGNLPGEPIKATAYITDGSKDNILRLFNDSSDIAFVMEPVLSEALPDTLEDISVLARLYKDLVQVVVRKDASIGNLNDLKDKRAYVGKENSGTKFVADKILKTLNISLSDTVTDGGFTEAAQKLIDDEIDAAFFVAGIPTEAVEIALDSADCELLDITDSLITRIDCFTEENIPANYYKSNQSTPVNTVGTWALLAGRKNLDNDLVFLILDALFDSDNTKKLLWEHAKAQDIRIDRALDFEEKQDSLLHPGARKFKEKEEDKLLIATGAINGKYWIFGKLIQKQLNELYGISSRVIHTDGSVENLELLRDRKNIIAIMQYEVARASLGDPEFIYGVNELSIEITDLFDSLKVKKMRLIAPLHEETFHIIMSRKEPWIEVKTIEDLMAIGDLRVALGPEKSGTRIFAQALFDLYEIETNSYSTFSIPDMEKRFFKDELDVGFFFSYEPGQALGNLLNSDKIRLLSIGRGKIQDLMSSGVLKSRTIPPGTYDSMKEDKKEDEESINTIKTRALLMTREDLDFDVKKITEAAHKLAKIPPEDVGIFFEELSSILLHPDAEDFYKDKKLIASRDWAASITILVNILWKSLATIVIILAGYKGIITVKRSGASKLMARMIHEVSISASEPDSVMKLLKIKEEIEERVKMKWWQSEELNESQWQELENLSDQMINGARENLTRALLVEIRTINQERNEDEAAKLERYSSLKKRIWVCVENGELTESQYSFLIGIIKAS